MSKSNPSVFVIGSSATLLIDPYLENMLSGVCSYSRFGRDPVSHQEAFEDLDVARGANAGDSTQVLSYLQSLNPSDDFHPDVVLMHVGFHDLKTDPDTGEKQVPLDLYASNVGQMVDWFHKQGLRMVWMRPGPLDEKIHNAQSNRSHRFEADYLAYNDAADRIMQIHNISVLDLDGFTKRLGPMEQLLKDHVHFRDEVVKQQAAFIAGYLAGLFER